MVEDMPENTIDAKGRLNNVRNVPLSGFLDGLLIGLDMVGEYLNLLTVAEHDGSGKLSVFGECFTRLTMPAWALNAGPAVAPLMVHASITVVRGSSNSRRARVFFRLRVRVVPNHSNPDVQSLRTRSSRSSHQFRRPNNPWRSGPSRRLRVA